MHVRRIPLHASGYDKVHAQSALRILSAGKRFPADFRGRHNPKLAIELRQFGELARERFHHSRAKRFVFTIVADVAKWQHSDLLFRRHAIEPRRAHFPDQDGKQQQQRNPNAGDDLRPPPEWLCRQPALPRGMRRRPSKINLVADFFQIRQQPVHACIAALRIFLHGGLQHPVQGARQTRAGLAGWWDRGVGHCIHQPNL